VVSSLRELKDQAAKVAVVAKNLNNAAFDMKAYKDLTIAKLGNVDPKLTNSSNNDKPVFHTSRKSGAQHGT